MTDAKKARVSKTTKKAGHRQGKQGPTKHSVHDFLRSLSPETRAAFDRILGVELASIEEQWLDFVSMLHVTLAEYRREGFTQPEWKVIARGWPDERHDRARMTWVVDVVGFRNGPVRGLGPRSAAGLAGATVAASQIVQRLRDVDQT
jgi:hypothetical protein